jgi:ArsR family transcriptional regulator
MDEEILKSTTIFKALSNATRIEILMLLARNKQLIVQDFVKELNLAQSTVSAHLSVLKNAGLIKSEIQATKTIYTLKQKNIEKAEKVMKKCFKQILI